MLIVMTHTPAKGQELRFIDVNGREISKDEFVRQQDNRVNLTMSFQVDRRIETRLIKRENIGQLPADTVMLLRNALGKSTGKTIPSNHLIVVNDYPAPQPVQRKRNFR